MTSRVLALPTGLALIGLMACAGPHTRAVSEVARQDLIWIRADDISGGRPSPGSVRGPLDRKIAGAVAAQSPGDPPLGITAILSPTVWQVSQIADRNGDRMFIVVDKIHGKIAVFENGNAIFGGAALTGQNTADALPPDAFGKFYAEQVGVKYKVTPAGRFTVSPGYDPKYGALLDINELQGPDWAIAIHPVALGSPAQRRGARLRSSDDQDKHITDGCIDVEATTMQRLLRLLAHKAVVPIYILPMDESLILKLFAPRMTVSNPPPATG